MFYDLTAEISSDLVTFPGDPRYCTEIVSSLEGGQTFKLCHMHLGNHTGTHVDFPAHTIVGGKTSSDFPLEYLTGPGIIIKVPVEGLELKNIPEGRYDIFVVPLNIPDMDGLPARVFAKVSDTSTANE
jgi:kynurenine formamidase